MPIAGKIQKSQKISNNSSEVRSVLHNLRRESEEEETYQFAEKIGVPYIDLNIFPIDQEHLGFIEEEDARKYGLVIIRKKGGSIDIGAINPIDPNTFSFVKELEDKMGVRANLFTVSKSSIEETWKEYEILKLNGKFESMKVNLSSENLTEFEKELKDLVELEKRIEEIPVSEILNIIIAGAVKMDSSDIHLEPQKNGKVRLRYRIDGVLQTMAEFYAGVYSSIVSRIKMLGNMKINIRDIAQDGRFSVKVSDNNSLDIRVSILPGNFGENIVLRLLNHKMEDLNMEKVGVAGLALERLLKESEKKQGIILNSGPTGSGKTTTLYSIINRVNTPDKKIITIENPVEYQIPGITQTQVERDRGYDFASGLRAAMRQDPDVILIGEIRDEETADVAIQASLTGHLVLSTIHANSAIGVVSRLSDLGVDSNLIASSVNAMVAQRLVRKLCPYCREKYFPAKRTLETLKKMLSIISPKAKIEIPKEVEYLWKANGCPKCRGIGYKGRIGIFEILTMEDEIKEKILNRASDGELLKTALEGGMVTMVQDGILKAVEGTTSLEELQRVTGEGDYLIDLYEKVMIQVLSQGIDLERNIFSDISPILHDKSGLNSILEKSTIKNIIRYILAGGMLMNVSDIHIEPGSEKFNIRFRIDGVLQNIAALPMENFLPVLNEIKAMSGFSTEGREAAVQDGRFSIRVEEDNEFFKEKKVDVRVSIILGGYGDIIVMRVLSQSAKALNFNSLEINPANFVKLKEEVQKPNGIIINTGPTGSGKTTTLYTILDYLNKPEVKIITVEDPIEYQMEGIIQTQINEKEGYTFASAMKSLLRQNPDIMMIGEIRDDETAEIAYQAALTGHLVLSTMHTNSAAGSIQRLTNMRIDLSDIVNGTNCFMAQRLVRKLCPDCKKKRPVNSEELNLINDVLGKIKTPGVNVSWNSEDGIFDPVGCPKCHGVGYAGRLAITEILQMKKEMEKFLMEHPTVAEIEEKAIENGMLSLLQDGILSVINGQTTLEEILREVGNEK